MQDETPHPAANDTHTSSYAGRWVARVRGKVVAQGGTPEQALRAAQTTRHKEKPEIIYMPAPFSLPPLIDRIKGLLPPEQEICLVGGAVRDLLINRLSRDFDFALPSNGISFARTIARQLQADYMTLDDERGTGRVIVTEPDDSRIFLDFASYRGDSLEADLRGRDFTINALAYDLRNDTIIDPLEGASDLRAKRIRACTPASFSDDPVRILRAVRMAAGFGFQIEKNSRELMKQAAAQIGRVSPERLRDELFKILEGPKPDASMRALEMLGVLPHLLPELTELKGVEQSPPHVYDVWTHTLAVLGELENILAALRVGYSADNTTDLFTGLLTLRLGRYREQFAKHFAESLNTDRSMRSLLFFAALYHDVRKPQTKTFDEEKGRIRFFDHDEQGAEAATERARAFNLSNDEIQRLRAIIKNHMRIHFHTSRMEGEDKSPSRKAIYRFFRESGEAGVDLTLLALADLRGTRANTLTQETWSACLDVCRILLENYWEKPEESVAPPRLLTGDDLISGFNLRPGPVIGDLLEAIREGQATGKIETRDQAISFAREWIKENPNGTRNT
ncbi:MAG: HD domain-containing protein [Chloroflexi bacterium]|nr:HD domain-containing protein [Chloroflexota bacterium]